MKKNIHPDYHEITVVMTDGSKYKTHLIPSGVFYGIKSVIGPGCVVNVNSFFEEIDYLKTNGFNTDLIKISTIMFSH